MATELLVVITPAPEGAHVAFNPETVTVTQGDTVEEALSNPRSNRALSGGVSSLKAHAEQLKQYTLTVYFAARDPRTPFLVRALAALVAAYVLSPIDLIPDFIPVIGYLDDLLLVPLGLALVVRLTPPIVLESARLQAQQAANRPVSYTAAVFIISVWLFLCWLILRWVLKVVRV